MSFPSKMTPKSNKFTHTNKRKIYSYEGFFGRFFFKRKMQSPPKPLEEKSQDVLEDAYAAMTDSPSARNAIAATYRGHIRQAFSLLFPHEHGSYWSQTMSET
jgi:hypothetical protein